MTKHNLTHIRPGRSALRLSDAVVDRPFERLLVRFLEWRIRHDLERALGPLTELHLRDVGLTRTDVDAACAGALDRPATRSLESAAQSRIGNW